MESPRGHKMKQVNRCCVPGCSDILSKRHRFPKKDTELFQKLTNALKNPVFLQKDTDKIYRENYVCDDHFKNEDKVSGIRGLKRFAVPSKHLPEGKLPEITPQPSPFIKNLSKVILTNIKPGQEKQHPHIEQQEKVKREKQHSQIELQKNVYRARKPIEQLKKDLEEGTKQTTASTQRTYFPNKILKTSFLPDDKYNTKHRNEHDYAIVSNQEKQQSQNIHQKTGLVSENNVYLEAPLPKCMPNNLPDLGSLLLVEQSVPTNKPITIDVKEDYGIIKRVYRRVNQYRKYKNTVMINGLTITEVEESETNLVDCDESEDVQQSLKTKETNTPQLNNLICRLCKCECKEMTSLYSYDIFCDEQRQIIEIIEICASIQITINDALPQFACLKCLEELHRAFKFRKLCKKTEAELKKELEDKRKEVVNTMEVVELEHRGNEPAATIDMVEFLEATIDPDVPKENIPFGPVLIDGKVNKGAKRNNSVLFDVNNPIIQEVVSSKNRKFILAKLSRNTEESLLKRTKLYKKGKYGPHILRKTSKPIEKMTEYPQIENINFNNSQFEMEPTSLEDDDNLELATVINELNTIISNNEFKGDAIVKHCVSLSDKINNKDPNEIPNRNLSTTAYTCELCEKLHTDHSELTDHLKTHIDTSDRSNMSILYHELTKQIDKGDKNHSQTFSNLTNSNSCTLCNNKYEDCEHKCESTGRDGENSIESHIKPFLKFNQNIYKCWICKKKFKNRILFLEHEANIHNTKMYNAYCMACNIKFPRIDQLRNHKKMKHKSEIKTEAVSTVQQQFKQEQIRYRKCYENKSKKNIIVN